jgi:hypothetical protein
MIILIHLMCCNETTDHAQNAPHTDTWALLFSFYLALHTPLRTVLVWVVMQRVVVRN